MSAPKLFTPQTTAHFRYEEFSPPKFFGIVGKKMFKLFFWANVPKPHQKGHPISKK